MVSVGEVVVVCVVVVVCGVPCHMGCVVVVCGGGVVVPVCTTPVVCLAVWSGSHSYTLTVWVRVCGGECCVVCAIYDYVLGCTVSPLHHMQWHIGLLNTRLPNGICGPLTGAPMRSLLPCMLIEAA